MTQNCESFIWCRMGPMLVLSLLTGCGGGTHQHDASWKQVPITDVGMVVGEWEGLVKKHNASLPDGSVRLIIRANRTFLFAGQSASKVAVGSGALEPRDGCLVADSDRRAVKLTLYDHKGSPIVLVEATNHETGDRYRGELTKVP